MRCLSAQRLCWLFALSVAAVFGSVAGGGVSMPQAQAATAQLAFSPASSSVPVGGSIAVNITVANVSNLGGYDVHLYFNPAIVHVTAMTDAGFVTGGGNIVVCNTATIDNSAGTAADSCGTISPFGTPGPGVSTVTAKALLHASFTGVAPGTSSLTLTGTPTTTLEDPNGAAIVATLGTGSITVTSASVGGLTELIDGGALPPQTNAAGSSRPPYAALVLAAGLLAGVGVGAGCAMRRRRGA